MRLFPDVLDEAMRSAVEAAHAEWIEYPLNLTYEHFSADEGCASRLFVPLLFCPCLRHSAGGDVILCWTQTCRDLSLFCRCSIAVLVVGVGDVGGVGDD